MLDKTDDNMIDHPNIAEAQRKAETERKEHQRAHRSFMNLTKQFRVAAKEAKARRSREMYEARGGDDYFTHGDGYWQAKIVAIEKAVPQEMHERLQSLIVSYDDTDYEGNPCKKTDYEAQSLEYYSLAHQIKEAQAETLHKLAVAVEKEVTAVERKLHAEAAGFASWEAFETDRKANEKADDAEEAA